MCESIRLHCQNDLLYGYKLIPKGEFSEEACLKASNSQASEIWPRGINPEDVPKKLTYYKMPEIKNKSTG